MKLFSQRTLIAASLAAAFVGLSASAIAQNVGAPNPELHAQHMAQRGAEAAPGAGDKGQHHAKRMEKMQKRHAEHQAQLKTALKLSAAQEPAWTAFVASMAPTPPQHDGMTRDDWAKLTTPQRIDKMQAHKAERDARMNKRMDAVKTFYAALSPEQQKVFDAQQHGFHRAGMKDGHGKGERGGRHGGPGHHGMGGEGPMMPKHS